MSPANPSSRSALRTGLGLLLSALARTYATAHSAVVVLLGAAWGLLRTGTALIVSFAATLRSGTRGALDGRVRRALTGPVRTGLLGRRADVSLVAALLAPVLALAAAWWVGSTVGYATLEEWVRGTWFGTDPRLSVFLAAAALLALGAVCAAANSGLLPTSLLVAAPVFGAAVTRYGTEVSWSWGTQVVSLPNAVGVAAVLAALFGLPLAVAGFLLGCGIRRVAAVLAGGSGPSSRPERI